MDSFNIRTIYVFWGEGFTNLVLVFSKLSFCWNSKSFLHSDSIPIAKPSNRAPAFIVIPAFSKGCSFSLSFSSLTISSWLLDALKC